MKKLITTFFILLSLGSFAQSRAVDCRSLKDNSLFIIDIKPGKSITLPLGSLVDSDQEFTKQVVLPIKEDHSGTAHFYESKKFNFNRKIEITSDIVNINPGDRGRLEFSITVVSKRKESVVHSQEYSCEIYF